MENLGVDWKLILAQIVNFGLLLFLLNKFLYRPILRILAERRKRIEEGLTNAQKIQRELEKLEERKTREFQRAQEEGQRILAKAKEISEEILGKARIQAGRESLEIFAKAKKQLEQERGEMRQSLKEEVVGLTFAIVEKLVAQKIDQEKNEKLIGKILREFKNEKKVIH